jgi:hypothetical protein
MERKNDARNGKEKRETQGQSQKYPALNVIIQSSKKIDAAL